MEKDKNPMPELVLFPSLDRVKRVVHFLFDHITSPGLSDHFQNTGGGPALDRALYEQGELDYGRDEQTI